MEAGSMSIKHHLQRILSQIEVTGKRQYTLLHSWLPGVEDIPTAAARRLLSIKASPKTKDIAKTSSVLLILAKYSEFANRDWHIKFISTKIKEVYSAEIR